MLKPHHFTVRALVLATASCVTAREQVLLDERFPAEERQRIAVFQRACPSVVHSRILAAHPWSRRLDPDESSRRNS